MSASPDLTSIKAANHFHAGLDHWKTGNRDGAILEWEKALTLDPTLSEARFNLNNARRDKQIVEDRKSCFESVDALSCLNSSKGLAKDPPENMIESLDNYHLSANPRSKNIKSYRMEGQLDSRSDDFLNTVTALKNHLQKHPEDAEGHYHLGLAYRSLKQYESAVAPLKQAVSLKPGMVEAHHALGGVLLQLNKGEQAVHAFQEVVRLRPDKVSSYYNLALAEKKAGNVEEEVEAYLKALSLSDNDPAIHLNLGAAYDQLGRGTQAMKHTMKAHELFSQRDQPKRVLQASRNLLYYSDKYNIALPTAGY